LKKTWRLGVLALVSKVKPAQLELPAHLQKTLLFLSFPSVCPEPVLANILFLIRGLTAEAEAEAEEEEEEEEERIPCPYQVSASSTDVKASM
jgi:hypothetical protein